MEATATPPAVAGGPLAAVAPALPPEQLIALARDQRAVGEYEPMTVTLTELRKQRLSGELAREAEFRWAEAAFLRRDPAAVELLSRFSTLPPADAWQARAVFLLARAQEDAGAHQPAVMTYARYRDLKTVLEPYAALRAAAQQGAAGDPAGQLATLEAVAAQPIARQQRAAVLEQLLRRYAENGNTGAALVSYRILIDVATVPSYRAAVLWRGAQLATGEERQRWLQMIIDQYPQEAPASDALAALGEMGVNVAPYVAARIEFWHGHWAAAQALFEAALAGPLAPEQQAEAQRMRGLAIRGQGDFAGAQEALGALAQVTPPTPSTLQAELDYVQTVGQSGNVAWAIEGYQRFATNHPDDPNAPEALWRAVQLLQRSDEAAAMAAAVDLGQRYPSSTQAHVALSQAGFYYYRLNDRERAIAAWRLLASGGAGWDRAEGAFWAGAAMLEQGQTVDAQTVLEAAETAAPHSYYGTRARELLKRTPTPSLAVGSLPTATEQQAVRDWLATWIKQPMPEAAPGTLAEVANDPAVLRAQELGAVDLRPEARDEWLFARDQWQDDPVRLWHLATLASIDGQPYAALKIAERIVALSPDRRIGPTTPIGLLRLIYPTPYARVVRQYAAQFGVDPRLLYGLLRQESLFNPDATSWVGARGLAQVMPATAVGIAQNLQVGDFSTDQLYLPALSIRFGAHYIGHQLRAFDGHVQAAASAYNGGPGNAQRWLEATNDRDIFTELIDFKETREYVKIVYGNWGMYRMLYTE